MDLALILRRLLAVSLLASVPFVAHARTLANEDLNPEAATGVVAKQLVTARRFMTAAANPLATAAGDRIQRMGGNAVDAAIATQMVLNLTEPQSSGIGGGGFIVYYDAASATLITYDGRETAPAAAEPDRFMQGPQAMPFAAAMNSGLSVGTPGALRMFEALHKDYGKLPWAVLFQPAIELAENGFAVSPRLARLAAESKDLQSQPAARAYFMPNGEPLRAGQRLKNPELAAVLRRVASEGANAFYKGEIARDIVAAVQAHPVPGDLSEQDLAGYAARKREPVCGKYRVYLVCGMPPPSSGGIGVIQLLAMLERHPIDEFEPGSALAVHYFAEAGRLAYADRDFYLADPDYVPVPVAALLDPAYLAARSKLIRPDASMGRAEPGDPAGKLSALAPDNALEVPSTTHVSVVDAEGNALSMTTTIESEFGSKIFVRGFLLNNQLTDFSLTPADETGRLRANRLEAGKRPRSTMSPVIVLRGGKPFMVVGSPGGSAIINYIAKTLVGVLDWGLNVQDAIALPNVGSRNKQTELEAGTVLEGLRPKLEAMGHEVSVLPFPSGIQGIVIDAGVLSGGADPRREGLVLGE